MEDYKQRYEKALERAKKELETCGSQDCDTAKQIFRLFPELQKSEDARIKEELIHFLETCRDPRFVANRKQEEWIDWLEKQNDISPTKDELEALRIAAYEPTKNWSEKLQSLHEKLTHCKQIPNDKHEEK